MKYELNNLKINLEKQNKIIKKYRIIIKFLYFYLKRIKTYLEAFIIKFKLDKNN